MSGDSPAAAQGRTGSGERGALRYAFLAAGGYDRWQLAALGADASFRRYFRLTCNHQSLLLMDAPPATENLESYLRVAEHLLAAGLRAPRVYQVDRDNGFAIIEDFGERTYTRLLDQGADPRPLYRLAVDALQQLHRRLPLAEVQLPRYDAGYYERELRLFLDWYWPARTGQPPSPQLSADFLGLWQDLLAPLASSPACLVLRDYHVDNLMLLAPEGAPPYAVSRCGLLDFQDALLGSHAYDLVSLFEDARREVDPLMAQHLLEHYLEGMDRAGRERFHYAYRTLGAQRHCKVLGIFVRLCARDGKAGYLKFLPHVQQLLQRALRDPALDSLAAWLQRHHPGPITAPLAFDPTGLPAQAL